MLSTFVLIHSSTFSCVRSRHAQEDKEMVVGIMPINVCAAIFTSLTASQEDEPLEDGVIAGYAQSLLNHRYFDWFMSLVIVLNLVAAGADQVYH
jgi:hypothetical protein